MTLCAAWLREIDGHKELVFATDSCLSGGERWNYGVKLFELPRKDCLICFAGQTNRTYPLILNLISSIKFDKHLSSLSTDITEVLEYLANLFTNLCNSITDCAIKDFKTALGDFQFLFGGWSWKANDFRLWKLQYKHETMSFTHDEVEDENMFFTFIGDGLDKAREIPEEETPRLVRKFDMQPFTVLIRMIRDKNYSDIDGSIQIAKIYPPGTTEFFGVYWPSIDGGKKTFLGKEVSIDDNPDVKFIDPDTGEILDENLPENLCNIKKEIYGNDTEFLLKCYPDGKLHTGLTKRKKCVIKSILIRVAYDKFIEQQTIILDEAE
jgi:hypothetical protein